MPLSLTADHGRDRLVRDVNWHIDNVQAMALPKCAAAQWLGLLLALQCQGWMFSKSCKRLGLLLAEGIAEAPQGASPLGAVAVGLERASSAMGPLNRELGPRLKAAVAASSELQERDAL